MKYLRVILIVLLLGCCTLWVASYLWITWTSSDGLQVLQLRDGGFTVARYNYDLKNHYGLTIAGYASLPTRWRPVFWPIDEPADWFSWGIRGTFWLPTLLLALPVAILMSPWARRRRRAKQGLCIRCGYDLSGTDHTLCPECGRDASTGDSA